MKLNTKLKFFLLIITIIAITILTYFSNTIFLKGYYDLEKEYAKSQFEKVDTELNELRLKYKPILKDWSYWDDTYEFIENKSERYIESNLVRSTFEDIGIDYICFFDSENKLVYGGEYIYESKILNNKLNSKLINLIKEAAFGNGFYKIDDKVLVINKSEVTDSNREKKSNGSMVFAYYLEKEEVLNKIKSSEYSISYELNTIKNFKGKYKIYRKDNKLNLLLFLPYTNSDSGIKFMLHFTSRISDLGKENYKKLFVFLIVFLLVLSFALKILLDKFIVNRIRVLNNVVKKINLEKKSNERVKVESNGNDEICELKNNINSMLEKIENQHKELSDYASIDSLTGVFNRRVGLKKLGKALIDKKKEENLTICFSDINDLKVINDKFGHNKGDELIKEVVNIIKKNIKEKDFISRLGGDEFLIVFIDSCEEKVMSIINQILDDIQIFNLSDKRDYIISLSNGIQEYEEGLSLDSFIEKADQKMYDNKKKIKSLE